MTTLTMNRNPDNTNSMNASMSADDSEESFVVLSPSLAPDYMENMMSINSEMVNSTNSLVFPNPQIPKEISQAISSMSISATSELSSEEIHSKLDSLLHENLQLKETLHQNNLAMKKQFTTLVTWQEDVMKVHQSHKEKFEETKKLISNLRAENTELKKQSVSLPAINGTSSVNETEIINLKSKISALEFELETLRNGYVKKETEQSTKITELETKLVNVEKEKDELITHLTHDVTNLKTELKDTKEQLDVAQKRVLELANKIPTINQLETIEKLTKELQELTSDLEYKNKVLESKSEVVDKLTEENKKLATENETILIYKTQVEVYQKDFNTERDLRTAIQEEKERVSNDLRHLQRRNQELIEELENIRDCSEVVQGASASSRRNRSPVRETTPPAPQYICPLCESTFRTMKFLEEHVNECIQ